MLRDARLRAAEARARTADLWILLRGDPHGLPEGEPHRRVGGQLLCGCGTCEEREKGDEQSERQADRDEARESQTVHQSACVETGPASGRMARRKNSRIC